MSVQPLEWRFKLIGGQPSLDFANTVGGRSQSAKPKGRHYDEEVRDERLEKYSDLLAWSKKSGLLSENEIRILQRKANEDRKAAEVVLRRARKFRELVYRLFQAAIEGRRPDTFDMRNLNEELLLARRHQRLTYDDDGFHFDWESSDIALDKMLWLLAQSTADMLTSDKLDRVRQCNGENCGWVFLDTSRSGNRTWCDMRDCGNLAKVRRHRQKKSSGA
jgi:predicted RNA-binding Zn ribbon-like protein